MDHSKCSIIIILLFLNSGFCELLADFENCWVSIYRKRETDMIDFPFQGPVSFPATRFPGPRVTRYYSWEYEDVMSSYIAVRKNFKCAVNILVHPDQWKVSWSTPPDVKPSNNCAFWLANWQKLVPLREGFDYLIILVNDVTDCQSQDYSPGEKYIIYNIIIPRQTSSEITGFTYQYPCLINFTCLTSNVKECFLVEAKSYIDGKRLIYEIHVGPWGNLEVEKRKLYWDPSESKSNYTLLNLNLLDRKSLFHKHEVGIWDSFDRQMILLASDAIEIWVPNLVGNHKDVAELMRDWLWRTEFYMQEASSVSDAQVYSPETKKVNSGVDIYVTNNKRMKFITKYGVRRPYSYAMYLLPYDTASWALILTTTLLIPTLFVSVTLVNGSGSKLDIFWCTLMVNVSALLKISPSISNVMQSDKFRAAFVQLSVWLLLLVVLVEGYLGVIVGILIVPPKWIPSLNNFADLNGFLVYGSAAEKAMSLYTQNSPFLEAVNMGSIRHCRCYQEKRLIVPIQECMTHKHINVTECEKLLENLSKYQLLGSLPNEIIPNSHRCKPENWMSMGYSSCQVIPSELKRIEVVRSEVSSNAVKRAHRFENIFIVNADQFVLPDYSDRVRYFNNVYATIKEGDRIAFMDYEEHIRGFEAFANTMESKSKSGRQYLTGTETGFEGLSGCALFSGDLYPLRAPFKTTLHDRLRRITESGLFSFLEEWYSIIYHSTSYKLIKNYEADYSTEPMPLNLRTNFASIFIICGVCVVTSVWLIGIEIVCRMICRSKAISVVQEVSAKAQQKYFGNGVWNCLWQGLWNLIKHCSKLQRKSEEIKSRVRTYIRVSLHRRIRSN